jgi:predicted RNA-binding protein with PIN domain
VTVGDATGGVTGDATGDRLVVDAMNVIGSQPTGWWRDRPGAVRTLVRRLERLAGEAEVTVVLDGRLPPGMPAESSALTGMRVVPTARGGPGAADDRIVALVAADADPQGLVVVTADRDLRARVRALGAGVLGPRALLERLARLEER